MVSLNTRPPTLFIQDVPIDLTGCQVGKAIQILVDKPLIMPQIQICLCAVFCLQNFHADTGSSYRDQH